MDIPRIGQHGLTMRIFECLATNTKIVTTNKSIKNYPFYNPSNIYILENDYLPDIAWFEKEYIPIGESVIKKYSIENWVKAILHG